MSDDSVIDCFVEAQDVNSFAYNAEILGDDEYREDIERKIADCHLIAAAPELLEALQNLRNAAYAMSEGCNCNIADKEIELADTVISKALGK